MVLADLRVRRHRGAHMVDEAFSGEGEGDGVDVWYI